jgi:adenine-specific DNA-methyltransferase
MSNVKTHTIEQDYVANTDIKHRKKFAQFFTPQPIAELMANWILGNKNLKTVLEPAFGLGVFSRELLNRKTDISIKGFEIDPIIHQVASNYFQTFNSIDLLLEDYMFNDWGNKYDGIICNPPYFKFHDFDNKNILREVEDKLNFKFNGFTNLYTLFLLKSVYQLAPNGRAAYIIPSEFLNSDYGTLVKDYLIKSKTLRHLFVIDFEETVFDDALTTASILLLAKDDNQEKVNFSTIYSKSDLESIRNYIVNYPNTNGEHIYPQNELDASVKWRKYYQKQNSDSYKNLIPFSNYAKVVRGIATGANEYFTFSKSKAEKYSISKEYLQPCICKAKDVKGQFFTNNDFKSLVERDELVYLFNAIDSQESSVANYIKIGESRKVNEKYLTKCRTPWYALEKRPPSPIWVSVFNRNGLRFIRNEANISNLTTFHCVYPVESDLFSNLNIDLLFAYLLTDTAMEIFNDNRREYGNGLKKFEPNDLNKAKMVDLNLLSHSRQNDILDLYDEYKKQLNKSLLGKIDQIIKDEFFNG